MPSTEKDAHVPLALEFLKLVWKQEDACELETDKRVPNMGTKAPACLENLGTVLSFLDRMASCWWICRGGDHIVEYLCGRVASTGRAALRLMRFGFYDEALTLCRSIGEIANLFYLFHKSRPAFDAWKASSRAERLREFSPVKVRLWLEELKVSAPIGQERYALLSERATHVHPGTKPQSHNILGLPSVGANLQDEGMLVCLNELAVALSFVTTFGALLLDLEKSIKDRVLSSCRTLAEQIGGATITEIDDYYREVLKNPAAQQELARVAEELRRFQAKLRE